MDVNEAAFLIGHGGHVCLRDIRHMRREAMGVGGALDWAWPGEVTHRAT